MAVLARVFDTAAADRLRNLDDESLAEPRSAIPYAVAPTVVVSIAAVTALLVAVGPAPQHSTAANMVRNLDLTLIEPTDRLILVAWLMIAGLVALAGWWRQRRQPVATPIRRSGIALVVIAALISVAAVTWLVDRVGMWGGFPLFGTAAGVVAAIAVMAELSHPRTPPRVILTLAALVTALALMLLPQTPAAFADQYHIKFTTDELSSVAAGHFPLADYVPQYTTLLPFVFAPLLWLRPGAAPTLILGGLAMLQVVTLAIAVLCVALVKAGRFVPAAAAVIVPGVFVTMSNGLSAATYFQIFPIRLFFPMVTIGATMLVLRNRPTTVTRPERWVGLGVLVGATALNNADFGLAAALTVLVAIPILLPQWRVALRAELLILGGAIAVPVVYATVAALHGTPVNWSNWLVFQQIFSSVGFFNVPMDAFGLQVGVAALSTSAAVVGFLLLRGGRRPASGFRYRQGALLLLLGGWGMGTLVYLTGRSLPAVYLQGYAFLSAVTVAAFLPLTAYAWRLAQRRGPLQRRYRAAVVLPLVATATCLGSVLSAPSAAGHFADLMSAEPAGSLAAFDRQYNIITTAHPQTTGPQLSDVLARGKTVQALEYANLITLRHHLRSVSVTNSAENIAISPAVARLQCSRPLPADADYLLLNTTIETYLSQEPACATYANWAGTVFYQAAASTPADGTDLIDLRQVALVPLR